VRLQLSTPLAITTLPFACHHTNPSNSTPPAATTRMAELVRGVNWVPDSKDDDEGPATARMAEPLVRGLNWVPDSEDDDEGPGSQDAVAVVEDAVAIAEDAVAVVEDANDVSHIAQALLQLASTEEYVFNMHKHRDVHEAVELMMPIMCSTMYGQHDDYHHNAAVNLFWIGRGHGHNL
jgi:hypothetical protein